MSVTPVEDGRYLRELLDVDFTDEQIAVATAPLRPQLVVAGAGSGKTTVMAARVVHAVAWHGLRPGEVLGLTFTNKAAAELAHRVRSALAGLPPPPDEDAWEDEPTVATYHSYAASLVADHALRIGREPVTQLLTEATRWQVAGRVVRTARGPFAHLDWTPAYVTRYLLDLDAEMAEHLVPPAAVRAFDAALRESCVDARHKEARACAEHADRRDELLTLVEAYRERKRALDLLDFGDQVALAAEIARAAPEVGRGERERYALVLLDEYQDTGVAQRVLLSALFGQGHPVTAVGDPCQAIYGWRGASVGNLLRFHEHFPGGEPTPGYLLTSFRSGGRLVHVANVVSAPLRRPPAPPSRRPYLEVPLLRPVPGREDDGRVVAALHETVRDEAEWVAAAFAAEVEVGTPPGECAVLCRRRADFPAVFAALVEAGLPVEVVGLGGLLEMPEVADVVAVLRLVADPGANAALLRVVTGPRWRIGPRDLAALGDRARRLARRERTDAAGDPRTALRVAVDGGDPCDAVALTDALDDLGAPAAYSPEAYERFRELAAELRSLRSLITQPVVEAVAEVLRTTGLDVEVEAGPPALATARAANLAAFVDAAAQFAGVEGEADLGAFLAYLDAASDAEHGLDVGGVSGADTVKLLTVHKAKGLEWEVVAVPGVCAGVFPSRQGRARWTAAARALPFALRGDAEDLPADPTYDKGGVAEFDAACRAEDEVEERRLAYVAVTRARRLLLVSAARWGETQVRPRPPSPYLEEIAEHAEVPVWAEEPGTANPLRAEGAEVAWPPAYDADAFAARLAAAGLVRRAMAGEVAPLLPGDADDEADLLLAELSRESSRVREVALPRRLTATQVVRLAADPDGLAAELARPMPRPPRPAARRGTAFHAWVEARHAERPLLDPDDLPGAADPTTLGDADLEALREAFLATPYGSRPPVAVEAPFELVVGDRLVRGRIDAVYETPDGGYEVVDFKTGEPPTGRAAEAAALQLSCYRLAWATLRGVDPDRVAAGFLYVRTGTLHRPATLLDAAGLAALLTTG